MRAPWRIITWTPPATQEGAIWFSAGFVVSDGISQTPEFDSVRELAMPIQPAQKAGAAYEQVLRSGCALAPWPQQRAGFAALAIAFAAVAVIARRARSKERRR